MLSVMSGKRTFRSSKVYHIAIFFEHVHLLDCLDGLSVELLKRRLQLLVIPNRRLVNLLRFSSWCALASALSPLSVKHS